MMASAAPKPAAAEKPRVNGLASGLPRMVCICRPARPRQAPTSAPIRVCGMRSCHRMVATSTSSPAGPAIRPRQTSAKGMPEGPVVRSSSSSATSTTQDRTMSMSRRAETRR